MNTDEERELEPTTDDLWLQTQTDDATAPVEESDTPETTTPTDDEPEAAAQPFDPEAFKRELYEHFEKTVLPQREEQVLREAQKRARQSQEDREKRINDKLAPVWALLQRQQQAGYLTPEDAQAQLREAHQQVTQQEEAQAKQQAEWEQRQQWLARQQPSQPARAVDAEGWGKIFTQILQSSGLKDGDPELELIPLEVSDPDPLRAKALIESAVAEAVKTKQQRIKDTPARKTADLRTMPDMGVGAGAGGVNPLAGIEDMDELWKLSQV